MAPRHYKTTSSDAWWKAAYFQPHIEVKYEYLMDDDTLLPNDKIKLKNQSGVYLFGHYAYNANTDTSWVTAMEVKTGASHSFRPEKIKGKVKVRKKRGRN